MPTNDVMMWGKCLEGKDRIVNQTELFDGKVSVSTVFLGMDHGFRRGLEDYRCGPKLYETMVFGGPLDQDCIRYATWEIAESGHDRAVVVAQRAGPNGPKPSPETES